MNFLYFFDKICPFKLTCTASFALFFMIRVPGLLFFLLAFMSGLDRSLEGSLQELVMQKIGPILVSKANSTDISVSASLSMICRLKKDKDPQLKAASPRLMIAKFLQVFSEMDKAIKDTQHINRDVSTILQNVVSVASSCRKFRSEIPRNISEKIGRVKQVETGFFALNPQAPTFLAFLLRNIC